MTSTYPHRATRLAAAIADWRLLLIILGSMALLALAAQQPFRYSFQVGIERGPRSDLPFVDGFYAPELITWDNSWRWSRDEATITLPGVGRRPLMLNLMIVAHRGSWQPEGGPVTMTLDAGAGPVLITLRPGAARYALYVPASALGDGVLHLRLKTDPWSNPNDRRSPLGVAVGGDLIVAGLGDAPVRPDLGLLLGWPLGLGLLWLACRAGGLSPWPSTAVMAGPALAVPLAALFEAPRLAFGGVWPVEAGMITLAAALAFAWATPPLLRRLAIPAPARLLPWLILLLSLSFYLKYTGQIYPASMPGDLQLHINRFNATVLGDVYIRAQHRGLPFPFPNAPYILLAPFILTGIPLGTLFELSAALFECAGVLIIYMTVARMSQDARVGFFAALTYAVAAVSHMNTWFSFQTQLSTQLYSTLLLGVLVLYWPHYRSWAVWGSIATLFTLVFLGHIGTFINTAAVGLLIIPLLWWRARELDERRGALLLLGAGAAAAAFASLFYYTAFWDLVVTQIVGVSTVGLNEVTGKKPIPRDVTLSVLWNEGLILHYGMFPVILALAGAVMISLSPRYRRSILPPLIWLTFGVALSQGLLPLITLSSITTRWLTFAGWAICVASAFALNALWRRGMAGRLAVVAMYGFIAWQTAVVWADALFLRLPPTEPF
ncbi:hypothetical protein EKD04_006555 [Chloroflexales bacterium ZM16-3]|nr:hypothetical protein [Chloroflexales bacterium ZM16-3]